VFTAEMWCLDYKGGVYSTRAVFTAQGWCLQHKGGVLMHKGGVYKAKNEEAHCTK